MASRLKTKIESRISEVVVELVEGGGGEFEVVNEGSLIFSKKSEGRFPEDEEIFSKLQI